MRIGEGSYCIIEKIDDKTVRRRYKSIGTFNTFVEHYIHTQVPPYKHLLKAIESGDYGYIVPYYPMNAFQAILHNKLAYYSREHCFQLGLQLIYAVEYMHRLGFAHGDISLGNIMLNGQTLVLSDFNLSEFIGWPNRTITTHRSYINYYRHYRNTTNGELSAATDWYATAIVLTELWGRSMMIQQNCYRKYRKQLGLLTVDYVKEVESRKVGLGGKIDDDAKEAITAAMFVSDDNLRHKYYNELRLDGREVDIIETLLNFSPGDDVIGMIGWTGPEPLPELDKHRDSPLYLTPPDGNDERLAFYRRLIEESGLPKFDKLIYVCIDRWFSTDKTVYLNLVPIDSYSSDDLVKLRLLINNNIYGRIRR